MITTEITQVTQSSYTIQTIESQPIIQNIKPNHKTPKVKSVPPPKYCHLMCKWTTG